MWHWLMFLLAILITICVVSRFAPQSIYYHLKYRFEVEIVILDITVSWSALIRSETEARFGRVQQMLTCQREKISRPILRHVTSKIILK